MRDPTERDSCPQDSVTGKSLFPDGRWLGGRVIRLTRVPRPNKPGLLASGAGASSMWASCCGLLNEVMGTGTVRAQQPGFGAGAGPFGAGAGPFRFAPSAGYSTYPPAYPPAASGSAGQLCKACGLAFSVFRRKVRRTGGGAGSCVGGVVAVVKAEVTWERNNCS
ncbi:hypothetical protein NHX12_028150 [Muraenolepis orangiensis]|uniref:Uncharacterized protein n=1 Tax=Muraenolepis orangiensis TaxID=630683 RepID=A0A9Q0EKH1_9TELE|nr:hypothetical protein NHX12_028150 [Muraenolepis orangiensis]